MSLDSPIFQLELEGAGMWSRVIGRNKTLRLTDLEGGANVGMMLYHATERHERYNMPDTLKGQHIFYLRAPYCLHSDMGRLMASITKDTVGWHDTVCGASDAESVLQQFGENNYQKSRNEFYRNARECFLIELCKWGLGERDWIPNLNWFSKVVADEEGKLSYVAGNSKAGDLVELRFEMDTLVVLNTCQHPFDPAMTYQPKRVRLEVFANDPPMDGDASLMVRPENARAYQNTKDFYLLSE
ncbi:urea carboxylase-associated family protein [Phragmitibacter flavus]|uniref:Urea carboxylase-associated family protein n=1 Tax=Phragmitibacter flavus TaxID=2576071 RepID=A0A5R8KCE1_9BACT|nr:urea amidolyase associated protein UAAP1 [Phragmitibacter flavus]TLD69972.1 urea carboxylase-associated family protein [Phragmitibacter flavus]